MVRDCAEYCATQARIYQFDATYAPFRDWIELTGKRFDRGILNQWQLT